MAFNLAFKDVQNKTSAKENGYVFWNCEFLVLQIENALFVLLVKISDSQLVQPNMITSIQKINCFELFWQRKIKTYLKIIDYRLSEVLSIDLCTQNSP